MQAADAQKMRVAADRDRNLARLCARQQDEIDRQVQLEELRVRGWRSYSQYSPTPEPFCWCITGTVACSAWCHINVWHLVQAHDL